MVDGVDLRSRARAQGKRVTPQRQLILDAIQAAGRHVTPNEIYQHVSAKVPALNRATVYRNLDFLCEMRLVVAAQISGQMYYELAGAEPHHHLVCRQCNAVQEIGHAMVKDLFAKIDREQSFLVDMDHLALFGLCEDCRPTRSRPASTRSGTPATPSRRAGGPGLRRAPRSPSRKKR